MPNKLTDSDIVKALEGAYKIEPTTMFFITDYNTNKISTIAIGDIVDLINRLQAEIARLKKYDEERDIRLHARLIATAKAEAYKEFAERLIAEYAQGMSWFRSKEVCYVDVQDIRNLLKELVGEDQ